VDDGVVIATVERLDTVAMLARRLSSKYREKQQLSATQVVDSVFRKTGLLVGDSVSN